MARRKTRQIRVYEETAQLIEHVMRASEDKKFADVAEDLAKAVYPDTYAEILKSAVVIQEKLMQEKSD